MLQISVVIVNYNVKFFLEQCLKSVMIAGKGLRMEIWVVDNNSVDDSLDMVRELFPSVNIIANKENVGFSKANNQAIKASTSKYVLLLNPDTVVQEDTFQKCWEFMELHPDAGALGVKLIDGKGKFLPESKRGLPTPTVAFYKIVGLAALFPTSRRFSKYHLGFLSKDETHEIEILAGCYMFMRQEALDKVGLLDEDFFMYGEDIDLSYRITQGGYKNYYLPTTQIIHYKGESTKKHSINYVFVFYNAMIIFAKKHFSQQNAELFSFIIKIAIYLRAGASLCYRFLRAILPPLIDASVILAGFIVITKYWELRGNGFSYPPKVINLILPAYTIAWITSIFFAGGYDKPSSIRNVLKGVFVGTIIIFIVYALLDNDYRFSRILTILGAIWATVALIGIRVIEKIVTKKSLKAFSDVTHKKIVIIGGVKETNRIAAIIRQSAVQVDFLGFVYPTDELQENDDNYIGYLYQLKEIIQIHRINEVIFCSKDISAQAIMEHMVNLKRPDLEYKIAPSDSIFIIGSNSIETSGEFYGVPINPIDKVSNKRTKALLDTVVALLLLLLYPIVVFIQEKPLGLLKNCMYVLLRKKSWIGYTNSTISTENLPVIKKGVLSPISAYKDANLDTSIIRNLNLRYAKDYQVENDIMIIWIAFRRLGS